MARIIISDYVNNKLEDLVETLHFSKYFGYRHEAKAYVDAIYDFMYKIENEMKRLRQLRNTVSGIAGINLTKEQADIFCLM